MTGEKDWRERMERKIGEKTGEKNRRKRQERKIGENDW